MIVISSSMGKSGSTFLCNLQEDMLSLSGVHSGQAKLREKFNGRFIKDFPTKTILMLIYINMRYGSIVIKTHTPPTIKIQWLINLGIAKATYSYRDVRDVVLSALDHGARNRQDGKPSEVYANLYNVEDALVVGTNSVKAMQRWQDFGSVHFVRYESLMNDRLNELKKMIKFLGWEICDKKLLKLIEEHETFKEQSLNFNKGVTHRYLSEMTNEEQEMCNQLFEKYLVQLGYEE